MAAPWPSKPVRIVNPFPADGAADIVARALAQRLTEQLGQSFIVENRTGAGGNLGTEVVARSAADGYTLLLGTDHLTISRALYPKLGYDLFRDLAPVSLTNYGPHVLVAHPSFPADTLAQTIALAKA